MAEILRKVDPDIGLKEIPGEARGTQPKLEWLAIEQLVVDDRYQRPLTHTNYKAIRKIATHFDWALFSTVCVAQRHDGTFAIVDGQHRVHAAAAIGIKTVPCQINAMGAVDEARAFAAINGDVVAVTVWNLYKAALAAGLEWAIEANRICQEAGCKLMTSNASVKMKQPGEIYCVNWVKGHVVAGRGKQLQQALSFLRQSSVGDYREYYSNIWLQAISAALMDRQRLFDLHGFEAVLKRFNQFDLYAMEDRVDAFRKQAMRTGGSGFSKSEALAADIGTALDKAFPVRVAMPGEDA